MKQPSGPNSGRVVRALALQWKHIILTGANCLVVWSLLACWIDILHLAHVRCDRMPFSAFQLNPSCQGQIPINQITMTERGDNYRLLQDTHNLNTVFPSGKKKTTKKKNPTCRYRQPVWDMERLPEDTCRVWHKCECLCSPNKRSRVHGAVIEKCWYLNNLWKDSIFIQWALQTLFGVLYQTLLFRSKSFKERDVHFRKTDDDHKSDLLARGQYLCIYIF